MNTNKENFLKLVDEVDNTLIEDIKRRKKYVKFYKFMFLIKFRWLLFKDKFKNIW